MRNIKCLSKLSVCCIVLVMFILFTDGFNHTFAQPNIPKRSIPPETPSEVKEQILRLYSDDSIERGKGAVALKDMGEKAMPAVPFLIGMLSDDASLIWTQFPDSIIGSIIGISTSPGLEAAKAISKIKGNDIVIAALKDKNANVRKNVALALGDIKDQRAVDLLISALKDKDYGVRGNTALALGDIKDQRAVEPLISALKDKDASVRGNTATALGDIKDQRAVDPLISALKDKDAGVRGNTAVALGKITGLGANFGNDHEKWQKWWKNNKKSNTISNHGR